MGETQVATWHGKWWYLPTCSEAECFPELLLLPPATLSSAGESGESSAFYLLLGPVGGCAFVRVLPFIARIGNALAVAYLSLVLEVCHTSVTCFPS